MPIFHCPICNYKSLTEKEEMEHARTHNKQRQTTEPDVKNSEQQKKELKIPNIIIKFLHKDVLITLVDGSTISGKLTEFNNYDLMIDDQMLIPKHAMMKMVEIKTKA